MINQQVHTYNVNITSNLHNKENYSFKFACKYLEVYKQGTNENNDFYLLNSNKELQKKGVYLFLSENKRIIYIGCCYSDEKNRNIIDRVKQHFRDGDTGSIRRKLNSEQKLILENSSLYYLILENDIREILFTEALLIGSIRPEFNFIYSQVNI